MERNDELWRERINYDLLIYYENNILKEKSYCLINISQELIDN